jgi:hypothetical protein
LAAWEWRAGSAWTGVGGGSRRVLEEAGSAWMTHGGGSMERGRGLALGAVRVSSMLE